MIIIKILFILFIVIPFSLYLGVMIVSLLSVIVTLAAVSTGGFVNRMFKGKRDVKWVAPQYLQATQAIIISGLLISVYANVWGFYLRWHWLLSSGIILRSLFGTLLGLFALILIALATIHGQFELTD
jgi:hypothetical protein